MFARITTLLAATAAIAGSFAPLACAAPSASVEARSPWAPAPVLPNAESVWTVGGEGLVSWDGVEIPSTATYIPWIDLYKTSLFGWAEYVTTLAKNVDPHPGHIYVGVPDVPAGSYFVMVGEWGQSSAHFEIVAA